jgi:hypothetical protein
MSTTEKARGILAEHGKRLVRRVAQEDSEASAALFHLAAFGRRDWTNQDWARLLAELDASDLTCAQWLEQNADTDWQQ